MIALILYLLSIIAGTHALLHKRNTHSALLWIVVCLALPGLGAFLYLVFGVNRIKGFKEQWALKGLGNFDNTAKLFPGGIRSPDYSPDKMRLFEASNTTAEHIEGHQALRGCHLTPLFDGTQAYPEMLDAINHAKRSVSLCTYIFGTKGKGKEFIEALARAAERGVHVRVLIDGVGAMYTLPTAYRLLKKRGVHVALFLPPFKKWYYSIHMNLRNHRKVLVVDGEVGFTGGMNIHDDNFAYDPTQSPGIQDLHFKVVGPVVGVLQDTFLKGWHFATKENLPNVVYFDDHPKGNMICRGIASGPHRQYPQLHYLLASAIQCATSSIRILTPYLVLSPSISSALSAAAMRGVKVDIILPEHNNLSFVKGACEAQMPSLLRTGIHIYYQTHGFAHTKLLVVDDFCSFVGSANIDIRSLYLNFEFNLQVFDHDFGRSMVAYFDKIKHQAKEITLEHLRRQRFVIKLRNNIFKLFSPYL